MSGSSTVGFGMKFPLKKSLYMRAHPRCTASRYDGAKAMKFFYSFLTALLAACCYSTVVAAQPVQPLPTVTAPVGDLLKSAPDIAISNGQITARIARIDPARGFYNGTRFDQAGVITSLKLNNCEFYGPWFEKTSPTVLDYTYVGNDIVAGPDSAISGPVEEFAPLNFE